MHPFDLAPLQAQLMFGLGPHSLLPPPSRGKALAALAARQLDLARVAVLIVQACELTLLQPAEADAALLVRVRVGVRVKG